MHYKQLTIKYGYSQFKRQINNYVSIIFLSYGVISFYKNNKLLYVIVFIKKHVGNALTRQPFIL